MVTFNEWLLYFQNIDALPAAGNRNGTSVNNVGTNGNYWSSSYNNNNAYNVNFNNNNVNANNNNNRNNGFSVRVVQDFTTEHFSQLIILNF